MELYYVDIHSASHLAKNSHFFQRHDHQLLTIWLLWSLALSPKWIKKVRGSCLGVASGHLMNKFAFVLSATVAKNQHDFKFVEQAALFIYLFIHLTKESGLLYILCRHMLPKAQQTDNETIIIPLLSIVLCRLPSAFYWLSSGARCFHYLFVIIRLLCPWIYSIENHRSFVCPKETYNSWRCNEKDDSFCRPRKTSQDLHLFSISHLLLLRICNSSLNNNWLWLVLPMFFHLLAAAVLPEPLAESPK